MRDIEKYKITKKLWRKNHPELRARGRNAYYRRNAYGEALSRKPYTIEEDELILTKMYKGVPILDRQIAKMIKRSIKGIQVHRTILKRKGNS